MAWTRGAPLLALVGAGCIDNPYFGLLETGDATGTTAASTSGTSEATPTTSAGESTTGTTAAPDESSSDSSGGSTTGAPIDPCALLCGEPLACCAEGLECVAGACADACDSGVRCGPGVGVCCGAGEVCVEGECTAPTTGCLNGLDCEDNELCDPETGLCVPQSQPSACEVPAAEFGMELEWAWTSDEVMSIPVVVDLDGDAKPEVVVNTVRAGGAEGYEIGEIVVLDGTNGQEKWRIVDDPDTMQFGSQGLSTVGVGDVGDIGGEPDIIYAGRPSGPEDMQWYSAIHAVDGDGTLLWTSHDEEGQVVKSMVQHGAPALANLDSDPEMEVAYGAMILDDDGLVVWNLDGNGAIVGTPHAKNNPTGYFYRGGLATFANLDSDPTPELITGREAWDIEWNNTDPPQVSVEMLWKSETGSGGDGWPAVADFDGDGSPEVLLVAWPDIKVLAGDTGLAWCGGDPDPATCNNVALQTTAVQYGQDVGGPPVIADFDHDGRVEFGLSIGTEFRVYDVNRPGEDIEGILPAPPPGKLFVRWKTPIHEDLSGTVGASAFDFDADGIPEALFQDQCDLFVYSGHDGVQLIKIPNSSATIHEYPLAVDVDSDGRTEVLVVANRGETSSNAPCKLDDPNYQTRQGVYAYRAAGDRWAPTRRVWTQHTHHVTDAGLDGNPPLIEPAHWKQEGRNNFREALHGYVIKNAADLTVSPAAVLGGCPEVLTLRALVHNVGSLAAPAGIVVEFYEGVDDMAVPIATAATDGVLVPGGTEAVEVQIDAPAGPTDYRVVVDPSDVVLECGDQANNAATLLGAACPR